MFEEHFVVLVKVVKTVLSVDGPISLANHKSNLAHVSLDELYSVLALLILKITLSYVLPEGLFNGSLQHFQPTFYFPLDVDVDFA